MGDYFNDKYLDYLVEHESGFLSTTPEIIGTPEALQRIALEEGATYKEVSVKSRRRRTAKKVRKAGGIRKARGK